MTASPAAYRRKGTSEPDEAPPCRPPVIATYRELAPSPALRGHVRAYLSVTPGSPPASGRRPVLREIGFTREDNFCSPLLADGRASLVLDLGAMCEVGKGWTFGTKLEARAIGALRRVGGGMAVACAEMVGAYFEPGASPALLSVPSVELTDSVVRLEDLWGAAGGMLPDYLAELDEEGRIDLLESILLDRLRSAPEPAHTSVDVAGLARWVRSDPASANVRRLAEAAGVSRQHLTRTFRQAVGVSPKLFCRLARFQAGLAYAGAGSGVQWAQVAVDLGYADQSHMIAEFREMSSLTPEELARRRWFHPFILEAQARGPGPI